MPWIFPYLSVVKGNLSRSLGAIAYTEWFPNKLPCIFSREKLKVENRRSHMASASQTHFMFNLYKGTSIGFPGISLPWLFSREILRVENRRSHLVYDL
jgi:hypothetical protein